MGAMYMNIYCYISIMVVRTFACVPVYPCTVCCKYCAKHLRIEAVLASWRHKQYNNSLDYIAPSASCIWTWVVPMHIITIHRKVLAISWSPIYTRNVCTLTMQRFSINAQIMRNSYKLLNERWSNSLHNLFDSLTPFDDTKYTVKRMRGI